MWDTRATSMRKRSTVSNETGTLYGDAMLKQVTE